MISLIGLLTGYLITHLSVDECKGKGQIMTYLMIPFLVMIALDLGVNYTLISLFCLNHLTSSLIYLWRHKIV